MILLGSYVCYTTNTLDTLEAFIAETYVQLVATKSRCYSTSRSVQLFSAGVTQRRRSSLSVCVCVMSILSLVSHGFKCPKTARTKYLLMQTTFFGTAELFLTFFWHIYPPLAHLPSLMWSYDQVRSPDCVIQHGYQVTEQESETFRGKYLDCRSQQHSR